MQAETALSAWEGEMRKDVESHLSTRVDSGLRPVTQVRPHRPSSTHTYAHAMQCSALRALRARKLACK
eukprot:COSAG06_NODE_3078_length_5888_cov_24.975643_1_plen_68_part_00